MPVHVVGMRLRQTLRCLRTPAILIANAAADWLLMGNRIDDR
jgi:hypothetical protein